MPEEVLLRHCAPTLAGIKTGSLFSCRYESREEVREDLRSLNRLLNRKGLRMIPLKYMPENRVLLYIYRPKMLSQDLESPQNCVLLKECGYKNSCESQCICTLIRHLNESGTFPHEIGLFLGYPPEDVRGFIDNRGKNSKYTGTWKVYGDVESSKRKFEQYRKCTEAFCRAGKKGVRLSQLIQSVR